MSCFLPTVTFLACRFSVSTEHNVQGFFTSDGRLADRKFKDEVRLLLDKFKTSDKKLQ